MLPFSPSLGAEEYFSYLESIATTSRLALEPYQPAPRKRITLWQAIRIIYFEFTARRYASRKNFEAAAHNLSRAMELSLTNTIDLVPAEEWKRTLPKLGGDRKSMVIALTDFPRLTQLFQLTDQANPADNIEHRVAKTSEIQQGENDLVYRASPVYIIDRRPREVQPNYRNLENVARADHRARPTIDEIKEIAKGKRFSDITGLADRTHLPKLRFDRSKGVNELIWPGNNHNFHRHLFTPDGKYIRGRHQYEVGDQIKRAGDFDPISYGSVDIAGKGVFEQRFNDDKLMRLYLDAVGSLDPDQFVLSGLTIPDWSGVHFPKSPSSHGMHVGKSAIYGMGRRIASGRWSPQRLEREQQNLAEMEINGAPLDEVAALRESIEYHLEKGSGSLLDPDKLVVRRPSMRPPPKPNALVFCALDVSMNLQGPYPHPEMEMDPYRIDIARSFVKLLKPYFARAYDHFEMVYVLHSDYAAGVDEDNFFKLWRLPGFQFEKLMYTGLKSISDALRDYPPEFWNVFGVQFSNGRTEKEDVDRCVAILSEGDNPLLKQCKLFASIEIRNDKHDKVIDEQVRRYNTEYKPVYQQPSALWTAYGNLLAKYQNVARHEINDYEDLWPVFGKIFGKLSSQATSPAPAALKANPLALG